MSRDYKRDDVGRFAADAGAAAGSLAAGLGTRQAIRQGLIARGQRKQSANMVHTAAENILAEHKAKGLAEQHEVYGVVAEHAHRDSKVATNRAFEASRNAAKAAKSARRGGRLAVAGLAAGGAAALAHHLDDKHVEKNLAQLKNRTSTAVNSLHITPQQARTASALGQVGGSAGALTGAAIGATAGAFTHHAATGAGIGAAIGGSLGGGGGAALGLYSGRPKKSKTTITKSVLHPTDQTQHRIAQGGLAAASVADAVGAKSAWNETRSAVKPITAGLSTGKKVKAIASFASKKTAFPVVAGGIAATGLAEHVMHEQQKKENDMSKSAEEIFAKARAVNKSWDESKHKRNHGLFAAGAAAAGAGASAGTAHRLGQWSKESSDFADSFRGRAKQYSQTAQHSAQQARHDLTPDAAGNRPNYQHGMNWADSAHVHAGQARNYRAMAAQGTQDAKVLGRGATGGKVAAGVLGSAAFVAGAKALHHHLHGSEVEKSATPVQRWREAQVAKTQAPSVDALFAQAREISKLERETKHGLKIGAKTGAALVGGSGIASGAIDGVRATRGMPLKARAVIAGTAAVTRGAVKGVSGGVAGGGIGGIAGAVQARNRKQATKPAF